MYGLKFEVQVIQGMISIFLSDSQNFYSPFRGRIQDYSTIRLLGVLYKLPNILHKPVGDIVSGSFETTFGVYADDGFSI
jgi:hypothetical protein